MLAFPGLVSGGQGDSPSKVSVGGCLWWQSVRPPQPGPLLPPCTNSGASAPSVQEARQNHRVVNVFETRGPGE